MACRLCEITVFAVTSLRRTTAFSGIILPGRLPRKRHRERADRSHCLLDGSRSSRLARRGWRFGTSFQRGLILQAADHTNT